MLSDKLTVAQLLKTFTAFYGNRGYIAVFREPCYLDPISNQINPINFLTQFSYHFSATI